MTAMKKILVPTDFSGCSREAFRHALALGRTLGVELEVVHAFGLPMVPGAGDALSLECMETEARKSMARFIADFDTRGMLVGERVEAGRPDEVILAIAKEGDFDMIVMGTHGRSGLSHLVLGSVAERVMQRSVCPVLTVKALS